MAGRGRTLGRSTYSTLRTAVARPAMQPMARLLRGAALAAMNYQPGHVTVSGELAALEAIRDRGTRTDMIFDVGANVGVWSQMASEVFPSATVHAFEPDPSICAQMDASTGPSVTAHCAAISDDVGTKTLHTVPGMSWLSSLDAQDLSRLDVTAAEDIDVPCVTLDQFCTDEGIDAIDLLKIDVEGHELSVLRGASGLLSAGQIGFVQFEMSPAWIETHTFLRDILDALGPRYRTSRILHTGLDPVEWTYKDEVFEPANYLAERIGPPS